MGSQAAGDVQCRLVQKSGLHGDLLAIAVLHCWWVSGSMLCHHHMLLLLPLSCRVLCVLTPDSVHLVETRCLCCRFVCICSWESMDQGSCHCVWHLHSHNSRPMSSRDCHGCIAPQQQACIDGDLHAIPPDSCRHCCTDAFPRRGLSPEAETLPKETQLR